MQNKIIVILFILLAGNNFITAQEINISGSIKDAETNEPLPGVSIVILNTTIGTISDYNGDFSFLIPSSADTILFSFIGYVTQRLPFQDNSIFHVLLEPESIQLNDVVVTALGIRREKKSLGYSVQEIDNESLNNSREVNVLNQLAGKVSGLSVSATNGGANSSNRIVLRGNNSLANDNQALVVIDGVPINNTTISNAEDTWGGRDYGNGIADLNPDDIESVSVLKGASASALYGSRALNGVILITTKKGKSQKGISVTLNSSTSFEKAYILYDFQNEYGAGRNGKFEGAWQIQNGIPLYNVSSSSAYGSWGHKMEGQTIIDWDGNEKPFLPQNDNYKDYFQTGITLNNSIAIEGGNEIINYRFNIADLRNKDYLPNVKMSRTNLSSSIEMVPISNLKIHSFINYIRNSSNNRFGLSDAHNNVNRNYIMMPRHISDESLRNNLMDENGNEITWYMNWNWMTNPYWNHQYELNSDVKDRIINKLSFNYTINENLNIIVRSAIDKTNQNFENRDAFNGLINGNGYFGTREVEIIEYNTDFLTSFHKQISNELEMNINAGGNLMYHKQEDVSKYTDGGLEIPYVYNLENSNNNFKQSRTLSEKAVNSIYASTQIAYNSFLFLELTGRNDWSSTLPKENNSYFYPSLSMGFLYSELFHLSKEAEKIFSYGKIRASIAAVGNDTDPYRLSTTYYIDSLDVFDTLANITDLIPLKSLKPERMVSKEIGTDMRLFQNRVGIDLTYYITNTYNQIVDVDISASSGSRKAIINTGNIQNNGLEFQLNAKPVKTTKFEWNFTLNYSKINSEVIKLADGVSSYQLLEHWGLSIEARPGNPFGDIVGYGIQRDLNGNKLVDANGYYLRTDSSIVLGNIHPDFTLSFSNSVRYKNISLNFLIDAKIGGELFAGTNMYGYGYSGNFSETLEGRDKWYASEAERESQGINSVDWIATGGYLAEGVYEDGTTLNGVDVSGQENKTYLNPEKYWDQFSSWTTEIHEQFIYDASFVKLRELSISYSIPEKWIQKIFIKDASISFYGRNLWLIYSKVPNIDPESFHTNGNGQGYELYSYPTRRIFGFSLNATF
jgi:TonB-linked SusC/RagA family outer membrane protein